MQELKQKDELINHIKSLDDINENVKILINSKDEEIKVIKEKKQEEALDTLSQEIKAFLLKGEKHPR